jgi:hypothetical protein
MAEAAASTEKIATPWTPGPYTICYERMNGVIRGFHLAASPKGSIEPVCEVRYWTGNERPATELVANALLFQAAPEMAALLQHSVDHCPHCGGKGWYEVGTYSGPEQQQCQLCDAPRALLSRINTGAAS